MVKELLALVSEIDDIHTELLDEITACDQKTQDVLHEIELTSFSASGGDGFDRRIKAIRQARREAKNQRELIAQFKKFSDDHKNLPVLLARILQSMKQVKQTQEARVYTPKAADDSA